jgi:hypothetical protein
MSSAKCRDKIIYNFQTGELVGFAHDAFNINLIQAEWKQAFEKAEAKGAANKESKPKLVKHFLLFYFTSWESHSRRMRMCVSQYGMETITGSWLAKEIRKISACLDVYSYIVDSIVGDGASKNRSCNNQLATLSISDVIALTPTQTSKLPTDKKIAFYHPTHVSIIVFIWSNMPDWVKKFVNALERTDFSKSDMNLNFQGQPLSLGMIEQVWLNEGGAHGSALCTNCLIHEHFHKDSYSRM